MRPLNGGRASLVLDIPRRQGGEVCGVAAACVRVELGVEERGRQHGIAGVVAGGVVVVVVDVVVVEAPVAHLVRDDVIRAVANRRLGCGGVGQTARSTRDVQVVDVVIVVRAVAVTCRVVFVLVAVNALVRHELLVEV